MKSGGGGGNTSARSDFYLHFLCFAHAQTFSMVDAHFGTIADGVFAAADGFRDFATSSPVPIASLSRGTVVAITLTGKSYYFSVAIASTNALNSFVHEYVKESADDAGTRHRSSQARQVSAGR